MADEIWLPIPGFPEYLASSIGRIKGLMITRKYKEPHIMATKKHRQGYEAVEVRKDGRRYYTRVHKLVCLAFHGEPPKGKECVNHIDGNKTNNIPENLEWVSHKENTDHFFQKLDGKRTRPRGKGWHFRAIYSDDEVRTIRSLREHGLTYHRILARLGYKSSWVTIQKICTGSLYTHVA